MAHLYKSSGHRNDPKWLGALRRADGGQISDDSPEPQQMSGNMDRDQKPSDNTGDQIFTTSPPFTGDKMDADTSANRPSFLRGLTPKKSGGRVRK